MLGRRCLTRRIASSGSHGVRVVANHRSKFYPPDKYVYEAGWYVYDVEAHALEVAATKTGKQDARRSGRRRPQGEPGRVDTVAPPSPARALIRALRSPTASGRWRTRSCRCCEAWKMYMEVMVTSDVSPSVTRRRPAPRPGPARSGRFLGVRSRRRRPWPSTCRSRALLVIPRHARARPATRARRRAASGAAGNRRRFLTTRRTFHGQRAVSVRRPPSWLAQRRCCRYRAGSARHHIGDGACWAGGWSTPASACHEFVDWEVCELLLGV